MTTIFCKAPGCDNYGEVSEYGYNDHTFFAVADSSAKAMLLTCSRSCWMNLIQSDIGKDYLLSYANRDTRSLFGLEIKRIPVLRNEYTPHMPWEGPKLWNGDGELMNSLVPVAFSDYYNCVVGFPFENIPPLIDSRNGDSLEGLIQATFNDDRLEVNITGITFEPGQLTVISNVSKYGYVPFSPNRSGYAPKYELDWVEFTRAPEALNIEFNESKGAMQIVPPAFNFKANKPSVDKLNDLIQASINQPYRYGRG